MASSMTGQCFFVVALFLLSVTAKGDLSPTYYDATCPGLQDIIKTQISSALSPTDAKKRTAASLLRLFFHDCFVQGCDGSVLLDESAPNSERGAGPNAGSLLGFDVIDAIKTKVEDSCRGVVSCADILALAAREAVVQVKGPTWTLELGRRDSKTANKTEANNDLPGPASDLDRLKAAFQKKGLNPNELAALSGAHTIGLARCGFAADRTMVATRPECLLSPISGMTRLDEQTPVVFDNKYYENLKKGEGLLQSDRELIKDPTLKKLVDDYISDKEKFEREFASAMTKLSNFGVLTGTDGEIRAKCTRVN